jgi:hypothetical protein
VLKGRVKGGVLTGVIPCVCFGKACKLFTNTNLLQKHHHSNNKTQVTQRIAAQSTESPIFDAHFWSENGVSSRYERNKIGDSVLWHRIAVFSSQPTESNASLRSVVISHACGFVRACKLLQIQKPHHSTNREQRIASMLSSHACVFETACKLFTNTKASSLNQQTSTHRIAVFSSHACVL